MPPSSPQNALDILAFHRDAGVDIALEDAPIDRFAESVSQSEQSRHRGGREALSRDPEPWALQNRSSGAGSPVSGFALGRDDGQKNSAAPVPPDTATIAARAPPRTPNTLHQFPH